MQNTGAPPLHDTPNGGSGSIATEFPLMDGPGPPQEQPMPPALQVLQDRWVEFDTMAVVNELVTWVDPNTPSAETPWMPGYGGFGDTSWEAWQLP